MKLKKYEFTNEQYSQYIKPGDWVRHVNRDDLCTHRLVGGVQVKVAEVLPSGIRFDEINELGSVRRWSSYFYCLCPPTKMLVDLGIVKNRRKV